MNFSNISPKLKLFFNIVKSTKNWFSVVINRLDGDGDFEAKFRNGHKLKVNKETWTKYVGYVYLFSLLSDVKVRDGILEFFYKKPLKFMFGKWGFGTIVEVFGLNEYKRMIDVRDKVGVDIGATFGDTAVYFLMNGAKYIYAFEAMPGYFRLAEFNIKLNELTEKCNVSLAVVGDKEGSLIINPDAIDMFGKNQALSIGESVPVITLQQIIERYNIQDGFLKIDTEGYEYEIIQNAPIDVLRKFSDILVEYHYGFEGIEPYLRDAGFMVSHTKPRYHYMPQYHGEPAKTMFVGYVIAKRK